MYTNITNKIRYTKTQRGWKNSEHLAGSSANSGRGIRASTIFPKCLLMNRFPCLTKWQRWYVDSVRYILYLPPTQDER